MRRWDVVLGLIGLAVAGCDEPDEIYHRPPRDFAPNGQAPVGTHYDGDHGFVDPSQGGQTGPSVEVCTDAEVSERWAAMVTEPVLPLVGAAGMDMRGGADWVGLTVDQAQSPDRLCQAVYYDQTGVVAWGDNFEVIGFFDTTTRQINDMLLWPGYLGTIEAGDYTFEINEPIRRGDALRGISLARNDGSDLDPKTDANMREMDRALIRTFRPGLDADEVDCIASGSCYVIDSGTVPTLVFTSVDIYIPIEPVEQRITQLEVALKRPFRIDTGRFEADGITPTIFGTDVGGIPGCQVSFGTDWADIAQNCLGDDPLAMAEITPAFGYEQVLVQMGGLLLYLDRPSLAADEILPFDPVPQAGDRVALVSVNAGYEGDFDMPYSDVLQAYQRNLDAEIREEVPELAADAPTGAEILRSPGDPALPAGLAAQYRDRIRPGGLFAAFCEADGDDPGTTYDSCFSDASGRGLLPLTYTTRQVVAEALGPLLTPKLADSAFYIQQLQRALGESLNGAPLADDQITFSADSDAPDRIYATVSLPRGDDAYTFNVYYGGNDDRLHFMNFQKGGTRMEEVLLRDAELPTPYDTEPDGVFTLDHLLGSPRLGLGAVGTVRIDEVVPETRRALVTVSMDDGEETQALVPYLPASSVGGYWIPQAGPHDRFQPAAWMNLYGNTMDVEFFLAPAEDGSDALEVVGVSGSSFFGDAYFCGYPVRIGDFADDLLAQIEQSDYPCNLIVSRGENREFVTALADMDSQVQLDVTNNQVNRVFAWSR